MLREASKKYKINLSKSFVIGDRWKDIEAGKKVNCQTIFINRGYSEKLLSKPDYYIKNLSQINEIIKF